MKHLIFDITSKQKERRAVHAAQKGDPAGFQFLYERYKSYVYSLCLRMTRDPALSEDLTQDIFLHVWRKISSYKGDALFRTWLYRVAINIVLLHFRRHKEINLPLDNQTLPSTELKLMENIHQPDIDEQISLQDTLGTLSPRYRSVLMLHDLHGYKHQDISQLLGITSGASRSQLHKARVKLRSALGMVPPPKKRHSVQLGVA